MIGKCSRVLIAARKLSKLDHNQEREGSECQCPGNTEGGTKLYQHARVRDYAERTQQDRADVAAGMHLEWKFSCQF